MIAKSLFYPEIGRASCKLDGKRPVATIYRNICTMIASPSEHAESFLCFLVCTYHREDLLERCLRSIAEQTSVEIGDCEVVVSDNSDQGTAADTVERLRSVMPIRIRYVQAHPANIAVARNRGLEAAKAQFVAMIDDDMTVEKDWLVNARRVLADYGCDVFSGPVIPIYERPELRSVGSDSFFHREIETSQPIPLRIMGEARTRKYTPATSNSIFRKGTCFTDAQVFDERYGKSGGEDVDLFCRLEARGLKFLWAPALRTHELVPARRCEFSYLQKRSFVGGQIYASTYIRNSAYPTLANLKILFISWAQLVFIWPFFLISQLVSNSYSDKLRLKIAAVLGKKSWQHMLALY